eukprot:scaffold95250_cov116-Phaeocystis_antarctica.AAC.1
MTKTAAGLSPRRDPLCSLADLGALSQQLITLCLQPLQGRLRADHGGEQLAGLPERCRCRCALRQPVGQPDE